MPIEQKYKLPSRTPKPKKVINPSFDPGRPFGKNVKSPTVVKEQFKEEENKRTHNLYIPSESDVEGVDYLNISKHSILDLGKELNPGYGFKFSSPFGKAGSVRNLMEYIVTPNYPIEVLRKTKLTLSDINRLPKKKVNVTNYWAIVACSILSRIKEDEQLLDKLKQLPDNIKITSFNSFRSDFAGNKTISIVPNVKMRSYVDIIKFIIKQIKTIDINSKTLNEKIISTFSNDKNVDLFHNCPVKIIIKK